MNTTIQSGMHPDAESLTAFAEQLLPQGERDQILAHMATCGRCREVVFLAQTALEADQPGPLPALEEVPTKARVSWFEGWRWAWLPVAALATFIGMAVVLHMRHAAEPTRMATNTHTADALSDAGSPRSAPPTIAASLKSEEPQPAKPLVKRNRVGSEQKKEEARQFDKTIPSEPSHYPLVAAGPPRIPPTQPSGASLHGMIAANAKSASIGGPLAANQFQPQSLIPQTITVQNSVMQTPNAPAQTGNNLVLPGADRERAAETVLVQADKASALASPLPPVSAPVAALPLTGKNDGALVATTAMQRKMQKITLPSGLGVLSVAFASGSSVAIDTAGAVFVSEDDGHHWEAISKQWTGRALLVRTPPALPASASSPAVRFELVTDNLQTWVSTDAKVWTPKPLFLK